MLHNSRTRFIYARRWGCVRELFPANPPCFLLSGPRKGGSKGRGMRLPREATASVFLLDLFLTEPWSNTVGTLLVREGS